MSGSFRQILRSSSIIGGASLVTILIGVVRTKIAAMLLGPVGVGLIGLYTNVAGTASAVAGLGLNQAGTREIARASVLGDPQELMNSRRALFWGTLALALVGALGFFLLREPISILVFEEPLLADEVGWLAIAVGLSVAAASQISLLRGMRRVGDMARVSIASAVIFTLIGVLALSVFGRDGLIVYVLAAPVSSFLVGHWFVRRLPRHRTVRRTTTGEITLLWRNLVRLGLAFMIASLATTVGVLVVRGLVQRELGEAALGYFQASWAISMQYIGFVLGAMATDFYPRLAAVIGDNDAANALVNDQIEVGLLLAAPIVIAMAGLSPWVISLLYSPEFASAASVLRWQVLGDTLKVASWPLGFILLASGAGKLFAASEWGAMLLFACSTAVLLPVLGLPATGASFLLMYSVYFCFIYVVARRRTGFRWRGSVLRLIVVVFVFAGLLSWSSSVWPRAGMAGGVLIATIAGLFAVWRLNSKGAIPKRIASVLKRSGS